MTAKHEAPRTKQERHARKIALVGVPMTLGADRLGSDHGPEALRQVHLTEQLRLSGHEVMDEGDLKIPAAGTVARERVDQKYSGAIGRACESLCTFVSGALEAGRFPLIIGGDHSLAMGSVAGTSKAMRKQHSSLGLLWLDAHGDMNTPETTESGLVHGMPLAHLLGLGDPALARIGGFSPKVTGSQVALVGVRDLDFRERALIQKSDIHVFTMNDIDRLGAAHVMTRAIEVVTRGTKGFHLSLDLDVLDPGVAPGVNTPVRGGLTEREARLAMELIAQSGSLMAMDVTELNPLQDHGNVTALLARELVCSALGRTIL